MTVNFILVPYRDCKGSTGINISTMSTIEMADIQIFVDINAAFQHLEYLHEFNLIYNECIGCKSEFQVIEI